MKINKVACLAGLFLFVWGTISGQTKPAGQQDIQFPSADKYSGSKLNYKIIDAPDKTYCYDIYADERIMIHQPSVPGLPGNKGFRTRESAEKVAKLVIEKIRAGQMPPSVTAEEMEKLNAY